MRPSTWPSELIRTPPSPMNRFRLEACPGTRDYWVRAWRSCEHAASCAARRAALASLSSVRDRLNAPRRTREPATPPGLNVGSPTFHFFRPASPRPPPINVPALGPKDKGAGYDPRFIILAPCPLAARESIHRAHDATRGVCPRILTVRRLAPRRCSRS